MQQQGCPYPPWQALTCLLRLVILASQEDKSAMDDQGQKNSKESPAEKGGLARARSLTPEERREIARAAARARWGDRDSLPKATHEGPLQIGNATIQCAVLDTKKRVLTQETFLEAMGRAKKAKGGTGSQALVDGLPPFLAAQNLKDFISDDLLESTTPVVYRTLRGGQAFGFEAQLLPKVCEVYLKARDAGVLLRSQKHIAAACDVLIRGLAHVGIIALVDEATGYQADRARDELNRILEEYVSAALLPWTKRFPNEFFKQIYRLHGWEYKEGNHKRPGYVGTLINKLVYEKLPPGVLETLQELNPATPKGYRKWKHFQWLTEDTGHEHLDRQLQAVTLLMRISSGKAEFDRLFDRAFGEQLYLPLPAEAE